MVSEKDKAAHDSYYMEVCEPKLKGIHVRIDGINTRLLLGVAAILVAVGTAAWGLSAKLTGVDNLRETVADNNAKLRDISERQIKVIESLSQMKGRLFPREEPPAVAAPAQQP